MTLSLSGDIISVRHWFDQYYIIKITQQTGDNVTILEIALDHNALQKCGLQAGDVVSIEVDKKE